MNGPMKDWDAMGSDWRGQDVPRIDVDALRAEAGRQGRRLRVMLVLETLLAVVMVVFLAWVALRANAKPVESWVAGGLALFMIPYQAYIVWLRRREWSEAGLDVDALIDIERRRCTTTLHYWRVGMYSAMGLLLTLHAAMWVAMYWGESTQLVHDLLNMHVGAAVTMPFVGLYGVRRCRLARERCQRLADLEVQLR